MKTGKTKKQFTNELVEVRNRVGELEASETERRRADEDLRESGRKYKTLVENLPQKIFLKDKNSVYISCNENYARDLKIKPEEIAGKEDYGFYPKELAEKYRADDKRIMKFMKTEDIEERYIQDGQERWVHTVKTPVKDENGNVTGILGIFWDISERKQADEALRKSRDELHRMQLQHQAVLRSTPHGLCMLTSNWIIIWANSTMIKILGLKADTTERLSIPFKTLFANEKNFNDYQKSALQSVRTEGIDVRELELRWADGTQHWCEISIVRLDPQETAPGFVATFSDITERKQAEEERKRSLEKLRKTLEETVNGLASAVEIRDPYTAGHQRRVAQLACSVAREMRIPGEQIKAIRMAGLIHDIGKIAVPAEILSKPSKLSEVEMDLIKLHPQVSFDVLKDIEFPWPVAQIVLQHHERMNGSGYPQGLSGEHILLEARILAVADVVEAMASHRPYRPALGTDKALEEISKNKGILYDSDVVNACVKLFAEQGFEFDKVRLIKERRRWSRVHVELACEVQMIIPDETFRPCSSHGCIMDLSVRGAKVRISCLGKEVYKKLLRPNRYVKLIFSTPESEGKVKVIGKIVWMDYKGEEQFLEIGTYFEKVETQMEKVLQQIVQQAS